MSEPIYEKSKMSISNPLNKTVINLKEIFLTFLGQRIIGQKLNSGFAFSFAIDNHYPCPNLNWGKFSKFFRPKKKICEKLPLGDSDFLFG